VNYTLLDYVMRCQVGLVNDSHQAVGLFLVQKAQNYCA